MTFSIVASDGNELGAAAASHWIAVGALVPWCRAGTGAVVTQAFTRPAYGPDCLDAIEGGAAPDAALHDAIAGDRRSNLRQVAVLDGQGRSAYHTGSACLPHVAASRDDNVVAVGNMLATTAVTEAMVAAFKTTSGSLATRLVAALQAGDAAGGDARGRQAAAVRTVPQCRGTDSGLAAVQTDLRVDDHPNPLDELQRLVTREEQYRQIAAAAFPGTQGTENAEQTGRGDNVATLERVRTQAHGEASKEATLWLAVAHLRQGNPAAAEALLSAHPELRALAHSAIGLAP